jgi:hypothetical protein
MIRLQYILFILTSFYSIISYAEIFVLSGSLDVKDPVIQVDYNPAFARSWSTSPFSYQITNLTPELCDLGNISDSGAINPYNTGLNVNCLIEWSTNPFIYGEPSDPYNIHASFTDHDGNLSHSLNLYLATGPSVAELELVSPGPVSTDSFPLSPPSPPSIIGATWILTDLSNSSPTSPIGLSENYVFRYTNHEFNTLAITLSQQRYDQTVNVSFSDSVNFPNNSCFIPAGSTSCSVESVFALDDYGYVDINIDVDGSAPINPTPGVWNSVWNDSFPILTRHFEWDTLPALSAEGTASIKSGGVGSFTPDISNLRTGESYTLSITNPPSSGLLDLTGNTISYTHDEANNSSVITFAYMLTTSTGRTLNVPATFSIMQDQNLNIHKIPKLPFSYSGAGIQYGNSRPATDIDGIPFQGFHDFAVTSLPTNTSPITINGSFLNPGDTSNINIEYLAGLPQVRVFVAEGTSAEVISLKIDSPSNPRHVIHIDSYEIITTVVFPETVTAGVEVVNGTLSSSCPILDKSLVTTDSGQCFVEWDLPPGLNKITNTKIRGILGAGTPSVRYELKTIYEGIEMTVVDKTHTMVTTSPIFDVELSGLPINRTEGETLIRLTEMTETPPSKCTYYSGNEITTTETSLLQGKMFCHVEWRIIPTGFDLPANLYPGYLEGVIANSNDKTFSYLITVRLPDGSLLIIDDKVIVAEVIDPIRPVITIDTRDKTDLGVAKIPKGFVRMNVFGHASGNGRMVIKTIYEGQEIGKINALSSGHFKSLYMPTTVASGQKVTLTIRAEYISAPDVYTDYPLEVVFTSPKYIKPTVDISVEYNDVDTSSINVQMKQVTYACNRTPCPYLASEFGNWYVFLTDYVRTVTSDSPVLSSVAETNSTGAAIINHDLDTENKGYLIVAESRGPGGEVYDRRQSNPVRFNVLKKSNFDGTVYSRKVSGKAPFTNIFRYNPTDRADNYHITKTDWEVNDGSGWTNVKSTEGRAGIVLLHSFPAGVYQVRAIVYNDMALPTYSEVIEVTSYNIPELIMETNFRNLIGTTQEIKLTIDGSPIDTDKYHVVWEVDGLVYEDVASISVTSEETKSFLIKAKADIRGLEADPGAGMIALRAIRFDKPRSVYVTLTVPQSVADDGTSYLFKAEPSINMYDLTLTGEWTLPDGSIVSGTDVNYISPNAAYGYQYVYFKSWYEEYPTLVTTHKRRLRQLSDRLPAMDIIRSYSEEAYKAPSVVVYRMISDRSMSSVDWNNVLFDFTNNTAGELRYYKANSFSLLYSQGGEKTISLQASNLYGDSAAVSYTESLITPPDPINVNLRLLTNMDFFSPPNKVKVGVDISGISKLDRVFSKSFKLNGVPVTPYQASSYFKIQIETSGTHTIEMTLGTKYGYTATSTIVVTVP